MHNQELGWIWYHWAACILFEAIGDELCCRDVYANCGR